MSLYDVDPQDSFEPEPDESCQGCESGCPDCLPKHRTVWFIVPELTQEVAAWLDSGLQADLRHLGLEE